MPKQMLALGVTLGLVVLLGAGCANPSFLPSTSDGNQYTDTTTDQAGAYTTTTTTTQTTTDENATTNDNATAADTADFSVTVTPEELSHHVKVEWTTPTNMNKSSIFRVLSSVRPHPESPKANWDQFPGSARSAELVDNPSGHRYFRVCEYLHNTCVSYSNEVEANVK